MTKQEVIKKAWGETIFPILETEMKRNGGNWYKEWKNTGQFYGNFLTEGLKVHLYREGIENLNGWFYPSELKGIEDNNGWTKIESEDDLPPTSPQKYKVFYNGPMGYIKKEPINFDAEYTSVAVGSMFKQRSITHFRPVKEEPNPLY